MVKACIHNWTQDSMPCPFCCPPMYAASGSQDPQLGYAIKAKSEKDFEGSLSYWKELATMQKEVIKQDEDTITQLRRENERYKKALEDIVNVSDEFSWSREDIAKKALKDCEELK